MFPLEPIGMFVQGGKLTSDTGDTLRFWAHSQLARTHYHSKGIILHEQFDETDWWSLQSTLTSLPRLFQLWAAKQVTGLAGMNYKQSIYKDQHSPICPSCDVSVETCAHVLHCREAGRVAALLRSIELLDEWLDRTGTDIALRQCLVNFAKGRGGQTMSELTVLMSPAYW